MREVIGWIEHRLSRLAAWIAAAIPVLLLVVWASSYLVGVLRTLEAPGRSLRVQYRAEGGLVTAVAESYAVDLNRRLVHLRRLRLIDPSGQLAARVERAMVAWNGRSAALHVSDAWALIVRRPNKEISVRELLPIQHAEGRPIALSLTFESIEIDYADESKRPILTWGAIIQHAHVRMLRGDVFAAGELHTHNGEAIEWDARLANGRVWSVKLASSAIDLATMLPHVDRWGTEEIVGEYGPISADRLIGSFRVQVSGGDAAALQVGGFARLTGHGLRAAGLAASAEGEAEATFSGAGLVGRARLREAGREARFDGALAWQGRPSGAGAFSASASSERALWPIVRHLFPREVTFRDARYSGWIGWRGDEFRIAGDLDADAIRMHGEQVRRAEARVGIDTQGLRVQLTRGDWMRSSASGAFSLRFEDGRLNGFVTAPQIDLGTMARRFGGDGLLEGLGRLDGVLGGTIRAPRFTLQSTGAVSRLQDDQPMFLGLYRTRLEIDPRKARIQRLAVRGPGGSAIATGTYGWRNGGLDLQGTVGGVDLSAWFPGVKGSGFASFRASGTTRNPRLLARAQIAGLEADGRAVPIVSAAMEVSRQGLVARDVEAVFGTTRARGEGTYAFESGALAGSFAADDVELADWTAGAATGLVRLVDGSLAGTVGLPALRATALGSDVDLAGVPVTDGEVTLALAGGELRAEGRARVAGGTVGGSYVGDLRGRDAQVAAEIDGVRIEEIPGIPRELAAKGEVSGRVAVTLRDGVTREGAVELALQGSQLAEARVGAGVLTARARDARWEGSLELGELAQFVTIHDAYFDESTRKVGGTVDAFRLDLRHAVRPLQRRIEEQGDAARRLLADLQGVATLSGRVSGTLDDLIVEVPALEVSGLQLRGRQAGALAGSGAYRAGELFVNALTWRSGDSVAIVRGKLDDDQHLALDAEISDLDLSLLGNLADTQPFIPGRLDASLVVQGLLRDPTVTGTVSAEFADREESARVDLSSVQVTGGEVAASGMFYAEGFTGPIDVRGPLAAVYDAAEASGPLILQASLARDLADIQALREAAGDGVRGTMDAWAQARILGDDLGLSGKVTVRDGRAPVPGTDDAFESVALDVDLADSVAEIRGTGAYSRGGDASLAARIALDTIQLRGQSIASFLETSAIRGELRLSTLAANARLGAPGERATGLLDGQLVFSGTLLAPRISGQVLCRDLDVIVPNEWPTGGAPPFAVQPTFERLRVSSANPVRVRSGGADVRLVGSATLEGPLAELRVNAPLMVTDGRLELPTALVFLEPLGGISLLFDRGVARLDVALDGRTAVTARGTGDTVQRYDVYLDIRGNLLETGGLRLSARSEPPDLTNDEILALLGHHATFERIAQGGQRGQDPLREALFIVATPILTAELTDPLAKALGFDYLTIDYNVLEQATVTAARTFGRGLTLQARRQLFNPVTGRPRYDVRLSYRIPVSHGVLARTRLGIGFDQDTPWRISWEYSTRF